MNTNEHKFPIILSIDTSCDETSVSVTGGLKILSNVVWSQSKIHAKFGGVVPAEARRQHEMKLNWVVQKSISLSKINIKNLDAVAVTVGPGLAIALGVGINYAKALAVKLHVPLIAVNHLEGHILSPLTTTQNSKIKIQKSKLLKFPAFGIVVSGGNTLLVYSEKIGLYKILAQTIDDALGESLDKSARLLGLGYPGGALLEKFAKSGYSEKYPFPLPMLGRENNGQYSYSGIKAAFSRLYNGLSENDKITKQVVYDLAASYQKVAFDHFFRVTSKILTNNLQPTTRNLLVGGGVAANVDFRKRVRRMCKKLNLAPLFPYSKRLYGDNAAMIGVAAYFKYLKKDFADPEKIDRLPNLKINGL